MAEYFVDIFHELLALSKTYTTFFASMACVLGLACTCVRRGLGVGGGGGGVNVSVFCVINLTALEDVANGASIKRYMRFCSNRNYRLDV